MTAPLVSVASVRESLMVKTEQRTDAGACARCSGTLTAFSISSPLVLSVLSVVPDGVGAVARLSVVPAAVCRGI